MLSGNRVVYSRISGVRNLEFAVVKAVVTGDIKEATVDIKEATVDIPEVVTEVILQ